MDTKILLIGAMILFTSTAKATDSLRISVVKQRGSILFLKVECLDPDIYLVDSEKLRDGLFNRPAECHESLRTISYHVLYQDSLPHLNSSPHWWGFKERQFREKLGKKRILQLPLGYSYILYKGKYSLFLAYHSQRFGKCIKSNVIIFEVE